MPLSELKSYLKANRHLPEFPSAVEVGIDGLNLGEINKLLTKKIGELTLYLIGQDEVDYNISVKLKEQEDRINKLEKQLGSLTD